MPYDLRRVGKSSCPDHFWLRTPGPFPLLMSGTQHPEPTPPQPGLQVREQEPEGTPAHVGDERPSPMGLLTWHMDVPEAGEGGIEAGTLLPVGPVFLHSLTHLLICHLQEVLQTQLARGDLLEEGRDRRVTDPKRPERRPPCRPLVVPRGTPGSGWTSAWDCCLGVRQAWIWISALPLGS